MNNLTNQERIDLEQVFAVIYTKKESKIVKFYREFYFIAKMKISKLKHKGRLFKYKNK